MSTETIRLMGGGGGGGELYKIVPNATPSPPE